MSELNKFLRDFRVSRSREYLLTTRLVHDLAVAAAASGYDLLVYLPTVDADGFDVILDDRDRLVPIQLKSVVKGGKARDWMIHRSLIRPEPGEEETYGFEPSPSGGGRAGGVILTSAEAVGATVDVRYSYTDIDVLSAFWLGILKVPNPRWLRLQKLRTELGAEIDGKVELPRSAFLDAPSPDHLLALAGLHSQHATNWKYQLRMLLRDMHLGIAPPASRDVLVSQIAEQLQTLAGRRGQ